jgi:carboxyl-terminal processing protease
MKSLLIIGLAFGFVFCALCEDTNPPPKFLDRDGRELSEAETRELLSTLGGVGVQIAPVAEGVVVQKVLPDTSACAAGVKSGDIITEVDSKPVRGLKLPDVVHRLRGSVGSEVALTLSRKGQAEPLKMKLLRKEIPIYKDRTICEGST